MKTQNPFLALQHAVPQSRAHSLQFKMYLHLCHVLIIIVSCLCCLFTKKFSWLWSVFQRLLCTFFLQEFFAVHSKETFKNVTAPLRMPVSHLALYGHTSCQVTRVQSHGLLWECTEIPEIFYRYLRCARVCGGCESGWGGLCNAGIQKLKMRLSDMRYAVCHEVESTSLCKTITKSFSIIS